MILPSEAEITSISVALKALALAPLPPMVTVAPPPPVGALSKERKLIVSSSLLLVMVRFANPSTLFALKEVKSSLSVTVKLASFAKLLLV